MDNEIEAIKSEIVNLAAENMAMQCLVTALCRSLRKVSSEAVVEAFNEAADFLALMQIKLGQRAHIAHTGGANKIIEQLRAAVLKD